MRKIIVLFLLIMCTGANVYTQSFELGVTGGGMYYLGDINTKSHFKQMSAAGGFMGRYNIDQRWSLKFSLLVGEVKADDKVIQEEIGRDLNFKSPITEFSTVAEFNFLAFEIGSKSQFTPYIFAGVAGVFFNPQTLDLDGDYTSLRDEYTEGQALGEDTVNYSLSSVSIPFGIGVKYSLNDKIGLSAEWGMRRTFTDYIDDISTKYYLNGPIIDPEVFAEELHYSDPNGTHYSGMDRGNPQTKDWYAFFGVSVTYKFNFQSSTCAEF